MLNEGVLGFALGLASGLATTPAMRWLAWKVGFVCGFNPVVNETRQPVAYLGGIAILASASVSAAVLQAAGVEMSVLIRLVAAATPLTILGLLDDRFVLHPLPKAALESVCAGLGFWIMFGWHLSLPQALGAVFIAVALVNAVNFLDASDGFAASAVSASLLSIALFANLDIVPMLVLAGAVMAFLAFNRPPASIYLGDAGSHFLGAILTFEILNRFVVPGVPLNASRLVAALAVVAVPVFDLIFTVCARIWKRRPWWVGSRDHVVFRMRASGISKGGAAVVIFIVQLLYGALGSATSGANAFCTALAIAALVLPSAVAVEWLAQFNGDGDRGG